MSFVPIFATRAQAACFLSIVKLIREHPGDAWLWTLTFAEVMPTHYAANMHRNLIKEIAYAQKDGAWPKWWGGVKVAELHPGGHGVHFHWVLAKRVPIDKLLELGHKCGFGIINVHPEPCTEKVATYLAKYLTKGHAIPGMKQWGGIGNFEHCKVADCEMTSNSIDTFKKHMQEALAMGKPNGIAFAYAKKKQREFNIEHENDTDGSTISST